MPQNVLKAKHLSELKNKYDKCMAYKSGTIKTVILDFILEFENFKSN